MRTRGRLFKSLIVSVLAVGLALVPVMTAHPMEKQSSYRDDAHDELPEATGGCINPPAGLVDWWPFDETNGGVANDIAGTTSNLGKWIGGPVPVAGEVKNALSFNGTTAYVDVPNNPEVDFAGSCPLGGAESFTIDLWINPAAGSSGVQMLLDKTQPNPLDIPFGWNMFLANGQLGFQMGSDTDGVSVSGPFVTPNVWTFVAVVVDRCPGGGPSAGFLLVNNAVVATFTPSLRSISTIADLLIGRQNLNTRGAQPNYYSGLMDEVEIFKTALTPHQLKKIWKAGSSGKCKPSWYCWQQLQAAACVDATAGLYDWWPFDETNGGVSNDIVGTNNAGVWVGGPLPVAGEVKNGLSFNGTSAYVDVANAPEVDFQGSCGNPGPVDDFTIDLWIKTGTVAPGLPQTFLDKRTDPGGGSVQGYSMYILDGRLGFQMADGVGPAICTASNDPTAACTNYVQPPGANLNDSAWHFVAVSVSRCAGAGFLYVDGQQVLSFVPKPGIISNFADLLIGRRQSAFGTTFFNGILDELEIFKTALTPDQLNVLYGARTLGKCKPCWYCWTQL
jgi:hypothetical protein